MNITTTKLEEEIFQKDFNFERTALELFQYQYHNNIVYKSFTDLLSVDIDSVDSIHKIPFLPIRFFKTHRVTSTGFEPEAIFESSGTTGSINSRHYVKSTALYIQSFFRGFNQFYGDVKDWCIIGLLPSYLERQNSSLVYMVNALIKKSGHPLSGFYLDQFDQLNAVLRQVEQQQQKTLLIGVTFALLDFAAQYPMPLTHTVLMETGGMKGRRKELLRQEVHAILKNAFAVDYVHSEYGMTELLSQAYSSGDGLFTCPPWMKILLRDEEDPLSIVGDGGRGVINVVDLANIYSCSFIATDDLGVLYNDGTFEITGRRDNSDLRGCSLMAL